MKKRAYVKYTKSGEIIPGSLIIGTKGGFPKDGIYIDVPTTLCCDSVTTFSKRSVGFTTSNSCYSPQTIIDVYMSNACYANPTLGCKVYYDITQTDPIVSGFIQIGSYRFEVVNGSIISSGQPCTP
jgi:hypothetical protein